MSDNLKTQVDVDLKEILSKKTSVVSNHSDDGDKELSKRFKELEIAN